jgi:hypothetical protein
MSRLYLRGASDARTNLITARGHQRVSTAIYYGSREDSKLAIEVIVDYPKGAKKPSITICQAGGLDINYMT